MFLSCSKEEADFSLSKKDGDAKYINSIIDEYEKVESAYIAGNDKSTGVSPSYIYNDILKAANVGNSISFIKFFSGKGSVCVQSITREQLFGDIYKYSFIIKLGKGIYDKIGVFCVVKEKYPWCPKPTKNSVMMVPGDNLTFRTFLALNDALPADRSMAVSLAKGDVDVWGVDLRWAFIPDEETDFSYMKNWNTQFHLNDIKVATKFSRLIRGLNGSGFDKTILLGLSRGGQYVYAYANEETQIPAQYRDIKGIIPIEMPIKGNPEEPELIEASLARYNVYKSIFNSGMYSSTDGAGMKYLGFLAQYSPNDESPLIPGFTNKQTLMLSASATYATSEPPMQPYTPFFHYLAGTFDENSMPTGFQFVDYETVLAYTSIVTSFQSLGEIIDGEAMYCGAEDLPYDDHFSKINLPVLYVGAAGGEGTSGVYTTTLLKKSVMG